MQVSCDSSSEDLPVSRDDEKLERLAECVSRIIAGIGEDAGREGLYDTPKRVAKAWHDMTIGYRLDVASLVGTALFNEASVAAGGAGLVVVRDIHFASLSSANLFPFFGKLHVGYVPANGVVLGLSKFARLAKAVAGRVQGQGIMTKQLAGALQTALQPAGVAVVVEGRHFGGSSGGSSDDCPLPQLTAAATGCFGGTNSEPLQEFLAILQLHNASVPASLFSPGHCSANGVDSYALSPPPPSGPPLLACPSPAFQQMQEAVVCMVDALGTDLPHQAVESAAAGYVQQLLSLTRGYQLSPASMFTPKPCNRAARASSGTDASPSGREHCSVRDYCVTLTSLCEHHMLPIHGSARVRMADKLGNQLPDAEEVAAVVECFSRRLQVQERLTHQLADALQAMLGEGGGGGGGVVVVCDALHMCMVARGVEKACSRTVTCAYRGVYTRDSRRRLQALQGCGAGGA